MLSKISWVMCRNNGINSREGILKYQEKFSYNRLPVGIEEVFSPEAEGDLLLGVVEFFLAAGL